MFRLNVHDIQQIVDGIYAKLVENNQFSNSLYQEDTLTKRTLSHQRNDRLDLKPEWISPEIAQNIFGIKAATARLWVRQGKIIGRKIGKTVLIDANALREKLRNDDPSS